MRTKPILLAALALSLILTLTWTAFAPWRASAADAPAVKLVADGAGAAAALKASSRHGEWVEIAIPGSTTKLKTWVVYPERKDKAPVVLVIHEIFGLSDWVQAVADQLAAEGFIALAPDLVSGMGPNGGGTDSFPAGQGQGSVGGAIQSLSQDEVAKRLDAVKDYALALPSASGKFGCTGYCWGGGASFNYAARQPKLGAAVVNYGTPPNAADMAKITAPVLGNYGGNDARITSTVEATKKTMADLKKSYDPHVYEGAGHGFVRQQTAGPNLEAVKKAWPETVAFFKKNLEDAK